MHLLTTFMRQLKPRLVWQVIGVLVVVAGLALVGRDAPAAGDPTPRILTCPQKRGLVWEPAHHEEAAGIVPGYIEATPSGGFRMIYGGARFVPGEGRKVTPMYAESDDGLHWPASRRQPVRVVESAESERGFELRRPAPKKGGGYYTIALDRVDEDGSRGAALWETEESLRGPWIRTRTLFPTAGFFSEPQGALGWVPEIGRHLSFIRPAETFDSRYWRSLKRVLGSADLSEWEPDFTRPVAPELTTGGSGLDQYYAIAPALIDGVLWGLVMVYHLDPEFQDTGNPDPKSDENTVDVRLFSSVDYGQTWEGEYGGEPFLSRGPRGSWEGGQVYAFNPVVVGDEVWIFYAGSEQPHTKQHPDVGSTYDNEKPYRMGLAVSGLVSRTEREDGRATTGC